MSKQILFLVLIGLFGTPVAAQQLEDHFYVRVLRQELDRNMKRLHLPDLEKPFFIAYNFRNQYSYTINAERGVITSQMVKPDNHKSVAVKLRVGDYHRNFDYMMYDGYFVNLPDENSEDEYRRLLWLETDKAYKNTARQYSGFLSSLKRVNVDARELALDDLARITPVVKDFGAVRPIQVDHKKWDRQLSALSALFKEDRDITTSYCRVSINHYEDYLISSEGSIVRKPVGYITFTAYGATSDEEGNNFNANYSITVKTIEELPTFEALQAAVKALIAKIRAKQEASAFQGAYMGPVLFTGNAVTDIAYQFFNGPLQARRKSILGYASPEVSYEEKIGQKVISADLSVVAMPSLQSVNGKRTTGAFAIDDEGVTPPDSLVLIDHGILKTLLNGRTPTKRLPVSQGFSQSFMGRGYSAGVLKLNSANRTSVDSMISKLLELAKEEGLPFAYIVKDFSSNASEVYQIDLATRKVTMVNECKILPMTLKSLRRFVIAADQVQLENMGDFSMVTPQSMIINEVEIEMDETTTKPKAILVSNPLLEPTAAAAPLKKKGTAAGRKVR